MAGKLSTLSIPEGKKTVTDSQLDVIASKSVQLDFINPLFFVVL